jgi:Na+/H+ antiporter NhaD/arsenite permease-like protein
VAIVAAANGGGAGSVVGDTTTTMMWIGGVPPLLVGRAFVGTLAAFAVFAPLAALQQQRVSPVAPRTGPAPSVDWVRAGIVLIFLGTIIAINVAGNALAPELLRSAPLLGIGLWAAIAATSRWRRPHWAVLPGALKGAVFLVSLGAMAAMMPVERLPDASWQSTLGLGFLSAVFDNIPLTALALKQGGYDWGLLAYAVGFGGSMLWFGSSAGVALSNLYPDEARSVGLWLRRGWFVIAAYAAGFLIQLALIGWRP